MKSATIGPLKLDNGKLYDAYKSEYCGADETQYYSKCSYRGYDYYATMTPIQEKAIVELLKYLTKEHNIPLEFKPNLDLVFDDKTAKTFEGIYVHTSVRSDKFDWPKEMLTNIINGVENKKKVTVEVKEEPKPIIEQPKVEPLLVVKEEPKQKSILEVIIEIVTQILQSFVRK